MKLTPAPAPIPFDYSQLPADVAEEARAIAQRVREKTKSITVTILELGRDLIQVKSRLGHGAFGAWLEAEFRGGARTAQNYMRAYEAFGDKCEIVSHLPPTAVYALAAPSVPERMRARVVKRLSDGEIVDAAEVRALVRDARKRMRRDRDGSRKAQASAQAASPAGQAGSGPVAPRLGDAAQRRRIETAHKLAQLFRARLTHAELETLLQLAKAVPDIWHDVGAVLAGRTTEEKSVSAGPLFD